MNKTMSRLDKPNIITLCGSTRFESKFHEANAELTLTGNIVISAGVFVHQLPEGGISEFQKTALDRLHRRKIDVSDEIFVINVDGYIGESTRNEIEYAQRTGKIVRYME